VQVQFSTPGAVWQGGEGAGAGGGGGEGEAMVRGLQATRLGVDQKLEKSKIQVGIAFWDSQGLEILVEGRMAGCGPGSGKGWVAFCFPPACPATSRGGELLAVFGC
jgi:hypothetical protein